VSFTQADQTRLAGSNPCELRQGRYGLFTVRLAQLDPGAIQAHLADQVASAPALLKNAPVVIDGTALTRLPSIEQARDLLQRLVAAGLKPLAVALAPDEDALVLQNLYGLPTIAAEHARRQNQAGVAAESAAPAAPEAAAKPEPSIEAAPTSSPSAPSANGSLYVHAPVRSGQQIYAKGRDLVITAAVSAGAEVIADGCIHVYGRLAGKALAGAQGNEDARVYCLNFQPELVSIAGQYGLIDSVPEALQGQAVEVLLDQERLDFRALGIR